MSQNDVADTTPSQRLEELLQPDDRVEELSSSDGEDEGEYETEEEEPDTKAALPRNGKKTIPSLFCEPPIIRDKLHTKSSKAQDAVAETVRRYMSGEEREINDPNSHNIPYLQRAKHIRFMRKSLNTYPSAYQQADASRPWMIYWALAGLAHMGEDVEEHCDSAIETFTPLQNPDGGFGGGHGQYSHVAATYAATLSLAIVGGLEMINRKTMWSWLGSIKQPDGGFAMAVDGEIDIRGAYCSMTIISLLNLPLELPLDCPARKAGLHSFTDKLGEWVGRCQTYEGGIGSTPENEAHGAYAFCGLACLSLLDAPHKSVTHYLDTDRLLHWLTSRQPAPEGGFSGRTNKLVDACYSHWVGGCWAILDAALLKPGQDPKSPPQLWNREALVRYTLCCSQTKTGGLRDKPGTRQDGYHTNYSLAGLSAAQNHWAYVEDSNSPDAGLDGDSEAAYKWHPRPATDEEREAWAFELNDTVGFVHPVFVIPPEAVERSKEQFKGVVGFKDATTTLPRR
ncbi:terpenoid cyclases/Protein prenyltransferase [Myriangium duriaei CBS 260.36]|uniref:Protein farnesyltransferase subunit beta n=1 Tax=Myriangium duriaei CBS 260.36 TaxID=1168546 RepID=A0A9P4J3C2_9PEZI|nr:terpenoid cyclases/Protein prenyltransferase [Myriangium duriaei CBS 260.36]